MNTEYRLEPTGTQFTVYDPIGMRRVTRLKEAIEQIISHLSGLPGE